MAGHKNTVNSCGLSGKKQGNKEIPRLLMHGFVSVQMQDSGQNFINTEASVKFALQAMKDLYTRVMQIWTWQMLMHENPCLIPILYTKPHNLNMVHTATMILKFIME